MRVVLGSFLVFLLSQVTLAQVYSPEVLVKPNIIDRFYGYGGNDFPLLPKDHKFTRDVVLTQFLRGDITDIVHDPISGAVTEAFAMFKLEVTIPEAMSAEEILVLIPSRYSRNSIVDFRGLEDPKRPLRFEVVRSGKRKINTDGPKKTVEIEFKARIILGIQPRAEIGSYPLEFEFLGRSRFGFAAGTNKISLKLFVDQMEGKFRWENAIPLNEEDGGSSCQILLR